MSMFQDSNKGGKRVYCSHEDCRKYIMSRFCGNKKYLVTKRGRYDSETHKWYCEEHC